MPRVREERDEVETYPFLSVSNENPQETLRILHIRAGVLAEDDLKPDLRSDES